MGSETKLSASCTITYTCSLLLPFMDRNALAVGIISVTRGGGDHQSTDHPAAVPKIFSNKACKSIFMTLQRFTIIQTFGY